MKVQDKHQNFWQLASIQSAAQSIPGVLIGGVLANIYGAGAAIFSIIIGNLILWLIGLTIISMASDSKTNSIENVKHYLGKISSIFAALILMVGFFSWFMLEIKASTVAVGDLLYSHGFGSSTENVRVGIVFGLLVTLLSYGGIRLIKWICVFSFPFLLFFIVYITILQAHPINFFGTLGFSLTATVTVIVLTLPGTVNLPTFFRHSRSKADSFLALTLMTIFDILIQISTALTGSMESTELFSSSSTLFLVLALGFIVLSLVCLNLVNIYFASAGLTAIFPHISGSSKFALIGFFGTATYALFQSSDPMIFLENLASAFIANLGVILLIAFLIKLIVKHRPRYFEKGISGSIWLIGCVSTFVYLVQYPALPESALLKGVVNMVIIFITTIFIEETVWSLKRLKT